ncbi:MAG: hypothetical protein KDK99_18775 [Verrucomicrobiales bacterium]|nr:hypothetical protein [Verrucomicrobiales bacterium]
MGAAPGSSATSLPLQRRQIRQATPDAPPPPQPSTAADNPFAEQQPLTPPSEEPTEPAPEERRRATRPKKSAFAQAGAAVDADWEAPHEEFSEELPEWDEGAQHIARPPGRRWSPLAVFTGIVLLLACAAGGALLIWLSLKEKKQNVSSDGSNTEMQRRSVLADSLIKPPGQTLEQRVSWELYADSLVQRVPGTLDPLFAPSTVDRRPYLHDADTALPRVEKFFARTPRPDIGPIERLKIAPLLLSTGERIALFRISTTTNEAGGLGRFYDVDPNEPLQLDWDLFEETHDEVLKNYLLDKSQHNESQWFQVGLRRTHGLELNEEQRETFHPFELQGAASGGVRVYAYCRKSLPIGKRLDELMDWSEVYLGTLLVGVEQMQTGEFRLMILDFRGSGLVQEK